MKIFGREPVFWIGVISAVIIAIVQTLLGQGVISDVVAGKVTDLTQSLAASALVLVPFLLNIAARSQVTPVAQPSLPLGTPVLIQGTGDTPPPDAVVAAVNQPSVTNARLVPPA